jgi:hypothetical protein
MNTPEVNKKEEESMSEAVHVHDRNLTFVIVCPMYLPINSFDISEEKVATAN